MCFQVLKEVLIIFESDLYSPPLGVVPFSDVIKRTLLWVTAVEDNSKMKVLAFLSVLANAAYISKYRDYNSSPFIRQLRKLDFSEHEITQLGCIDMVKINGVFHYKATSDEDTSCAVFFIGEIDEILTLTVSKLSRSKSDDTEEYIKVQYLISYRC